MLCTSLPMFLIKYEGGQAAAQGWGEGGGWRLKCLVEMAFQLYQMERATEMVGGGAGCAPLCVTPLSCTLKHGSMKMVILWYACFLTIGKDF